MSTAIRRKKEPVHKIFYICSDYAVDAAWSEFLKDCSFGKFPKGVRYENGALRWTQKKQTFTEYLPKDTLKAYQVILKVFRDNLKIQTNREKKSANAKFERKRESSRIHSWKDARTNASKTSLIRNYVDKIANLYCFSPAERVELLTLLELSISTKLIDKDRIHIKEGKIEHIDGLLFDEYTRKISVISKPPEVPNVVYSIPLDYISVSQKNYPDRYMSLLDYHIEKAEKAMLITSST